MLVLKRHIVYRKKSKELIINGEKYKVEIPPLCSTTAILIFTLKKEGGGRIHLFVPKDLVRVENA